MLLCTVLAAAAVNPTFLSLANLRDLAVQAAPFVVLACGMTFVILIREIDVSVGAMAGVLAALMGLASSPEKWGLPLPLVVLLVIAAGGLLGLLNGLIVVVAGVPSIVATLGALSVLRGLSESLLGGRWVTSLDPALRFLGTGSFLWIPVPVLVAVLAAFTAAFTATRTPWGRQAFALGSNPEAARVRGLPTRRLRVQAFVLMGLAAAVATLVSAPQLSVVESGFGARWELFVITCVVVGGVSVLGGRGTVPGVILAVLLMSILRTVLLFLKLGDQAVYWEQAVQGAFILGAVLFDHARLRRGREALA